jgi:hypothetical protein
MHKLVPVTMILALASAAWGQQAVSARAGLIQYVEGRVLLNDNQIAPKVNEFLQVEKGQTLSTEDGRAEILLTPGAFLRLSEDSSFKMISGSLSDTRLEVLSGSALVEVEELLKDNAITLQAGKTTISLRKHGLYRIDAQGAGLFRVYDGEAVITSGDRTVATRKGHQVELDDALAAARFDADASDPFYRWSERRAGYVATANVSSARAVMNGGSGFDSGLGYNSSLGYGGLGYGFGYSNWVYNPWFGMYTFVPLNGFAYSPFGYAIYSPVTVRYVVVPPATSSVAANTQRTLSPPTLRAAAAAGESPALGRSSGGGTAAGRTATAAPAASAGARSSAGGARGR